MPDTNFVHAYAPTQQIIKKDKIKQIWVQSGAIIYFKS